MDMKKIIVMVSLISFIGMTMYVSVDVSGNIRGDTTYSNYTAHTNKLIKIEFNLENIGSVTCNTFYRVDFEKGNKTIYTAWSSKKVSKPGDINIFNVYWIPTINGTIKAKPYLYMCDNIYPLEEFLIYVNKTPEIKKMGAKYSNTENYIEIKFNPPENGTYIIAPEEYPQGWKFQPIEIDAKADHPVDAKIRFETPFFVESNVKFFVASPSGNLSYVNVHLEKPKWYEKINYYKVGFYTMLAISIILLVLYYAETTKKKKRHKK